MQKALHLFSFIKIRIAGNAVKKIYIAAYFYYNIDRINENHGQRIQPVPMIQEDGYGKSTGQKRKDTEQESSHTDQKGTGPGK